MSNSKDPNPYLEFSPPTTDIFMDMGIGLAYNEESHGN
jgi:hypothetical protein